MVTSFDPGSANIVQTPRESSWDARTRLLRQQGEQGTPIRFSHPLADETYAFDTFTHRNGQTGGGSGLEMTAADGNCPARRGGLLLLSELDRDPSNRRRGALRSLTRNLIIWWSFSRSRIAAGLVPARGTNLGGLREDMGEIILSKRRRQVTRTMAIHTGTGRVAGSLTLPTRRGAACEDSV